MIEVSFANSIQLSWVIHHLAYAQLPHYHHYQILWSGRSNAVACAHPLNFILYFAIVCVVSFLVCAYRSHLQESGAYKSWELTTSSKTWIEAHCVQMRWRHRKVRNCGVSMVEPFLAARLKTWDFDLSILQMLSDIFLRDPQRRYLVPTGSLWLSRAGSRKGQSFQFNPDKVNQTGLDQSLFWILLISLMWECACRISKYDTKVVRRVSSWAIELPGRPRKVHRSPWTLAVAQRQPHSRCAKLSERCGYK